jgi:hypothetical protein
VLNVEAWVGAIRVDWGDGTTVSYPPEAYDQLQGYPDGLGRHMYEVKTCDPPGSKPRCHPSLTSYPVQVGYSWVVRWNVDGGAWTPLAVPETTTDVAYPVNEVISVLESGA